MEIRPSESPIYGGVPIEVEFTVTLLPAEARPLPHSFYVVFEGSRARHACRAQLIHRSDEGQLLLLTTAPPHDRVEATELRAFYRARPGAQPVLFHKAQFQFVSDAACQMALTLIRTQLSNVSSLVLERVMKDRLELNTQMHCLRRVDRRLAAAFRAIQKPPNWTIAPSAATSQQQQQRLQNANSHHNRTNAANNNNNNKKKDMSETLLHVSSRMGLSELCEYLLSCPGSLLALQTCNSQGSLPEDLARHNGYDKLGERLAWYRSSLCANSENTSAHDHVISESHDYSLPPTVSTNLSQDNDPPEEATDLDRLDELVALSERVAPPSQSSSSSTTSQANGLTTLDDNASSLVTAPASVSNGETAKTADVTGVASSQSASEREADPTTPVSVCAKDGVDSDVVSDAAHSETSGSDDIKVLRRPSFCRLSSSCPSIPNHLVHGAAASTSTSSAGGAAAAAAVAAGVAAGASAGVAGEGPRGGASSNSKSVSHQHQQQQQQQQHVSSHPAQPHSSAGVTVRHAAVTSGESSRLHHGAAASSTSTTTTTTSSPPSPSTSEPLVTSTAAGTSTVPPSSTFTPATSLTHQQQQQHASSSFVRHGALMHPDNEARCLMVNSKGSSVSSSALDSVALRGSPAGEEGDDDTLNSVKILVNDITPASSQEFLQASNPSSRRSSASDVRHSPSSQGNSIGGNTAQRLAKRGQLHGQSPESPRRQSWSDLSKAVGSVAASGATVLAATKKSATTTTAAAAVAAAAATETAAGVAARSGIHSPPLLLQHSAETGSGASGSIHKRVHKSPIKLQRSVSLNSLESAGGCDGGRPDSASNSSSELHTSSTSRGATTTTTTTTASSSEAGATSTTTTTTTMTAGPASMGGGGGSCATTVGSTHSTPSGADVRGMSPLDQTSTAGSASAGTAGRIYGAAIVGASLSGGGAGKPPSGASAHSSAASSSGSVGGAAQPQGPVYGPVKAQGLGPQQSAASATPSGPRGLPPLQLPLSSDHNYSMQPPPSPRQHRSASGGEAMLQLHRCHEDASLQSQSSQTGVTVSPSGGTVGPSGPTVPPGATGGPPPPVPPKFAKPLPPGVLSKKLPPPSLQKSISTPSIVVAQETLLQHSQSDSSRMEASHAKLVHQLSGGGGGGGSRSASQLLHAPNLAGTQPAPHSATPLPQHHHHHNLHHHHHLNQRDHHHHHHDLQQQHSSSHAASGRQLTSSSSTAAASKSSLLPMQRSIVYLLEEEDELADAPHVQDCVALVCRSQSATGRPVAAAGLLNSHGGVESNAAASTADSDDEKFIGKRTKKRGSLFFRKKKSMLINKSASQLTAKERPSANLASALKSSASSLGSKDRKQQGTFSRSNAQNAQTLQNDTTGGSSKESSPSSAAKGTTAGEELDSPYGPHGADMADLYAGSLGQLHEPGSASMESLDSGSQMLEELIGRDLDDPTLRLLDDEPPQWSGTVDKKVVKKLKERDVKRQEAIYELILTEKHHCVTLKIMEKLYLDGMCSELQLQSEAVNRMFPRLSELLSFHCTFLRLLRAKQAQANPDNQTIDSIGEVLLHMFQGESASKMLAAYGAFCSKHKDAVAVYKDLLKTEKKFALFIAKRSRLSLCKGRGIPECILLVTQRLTKYPLMIDALLKSSKDHSEEVERLKIAQTLVKDVINGVNAQVAEAERDARLLEIYHKVDAKSTAYLRGHKFKKSDLLSSNRKLRHEGTISLRNARGKQIDVTAVLLSDVIFFLQENNQKYVFAAFDNKPSVIPLYKLLVRERAGQDARGLYVISSNSEVPEMFEFICVSPKDKAIWLDAIRRAIEGCPAETDDSHEKDAEEVARADQLRHLLISLHDRDREIARLCQDKLAKLIEILETIGVDQETIDKLNPRDFDYADLLQKLSPEETNQMLLTAASLTHQSLTQIQVPLLVSSGSVRDAAAAGGGAADDDDNNNDEDDRGGGGRATEGGVVKGGDQADDNNGDEDENSEQRADSAHQSLGRSVSSAGEHQSAASNCLDSAAALPKRARTFGGFDANAKNAIKKKLFLVSAETAAAKERTKKESSREFPECHLQVKDKSLQRRSVTGLDQASPSDSTADAPPAVLPLRQMEGLTTVPLLFAQDSREHNEIIIELTHNLSIILCLFCQSASSVESLRLQVMELSEQLQCRNPRKQSYRPDVQLEELRNLQEQLNSERAEWQRQYQLERQQLDQLRDDLQKKEEQVKREQKDIEQQRDWLFRRLEKLEKEREQQQQLILIQQQQQQQQQQGTQQQQTPTQSVSQQSSPLHPSFPPQQQKTTHTSTPATAENSPRSSLPGRAVSSVDLMTPAMLSVMPFDVLSHSTTYLLPFQLGSLRGANSGPSMGPGNSTTPPSTTTTATTALVTPPATTATVPFATQPATVASPGSASGVKIKDAKDSLHRKESHHSSNSLPAALSGLSSFITGHHSKHHHQQQQQQQPPSQQQQQPQNSPPPKQVLPLHLAKRGPPQRSHSASSQAIPSPVHVRAGSSPAKMHYTPPSAIPSQLPPATPPAFQPPTTTTTTTTTPTATASTTTTTTPTMTGVAAQHQHNKQSVLGAVAAAAGLTMPQNTHSTPTTATTNTTTAATTIPGSNGSGISNNNNNNSGSSSSTTTTINSNNSPAAAARACTLGSGGIPQGPLGQPNPLLVRANTVDDSTSLTKRRSEPLSDEKEIFC